MTVKDKPWESPNPYRVKLVAPVCVAYGHPDLEDIHKNLTDFGLIESHRTKETGVDEIYYRGFGVQPVAYIARHADEPHFYGGFFEAATELDFQNATKIPGASKVRDFCEGGKAVTVVDPTGMPFHVVFGYRKRPFDPRPGMFLPQNQPAASDNDADLKPRRGITHRYEKGPTPVNKLGHCGYVAEDLNATCDFYAWNFNFKPSDVMLNPTGDSALIFFHFDLGKQFVDHHGFILGGAGPGFEAGKPHHNAFEVESVDAQFLGHAHLEEQGYRPFWGIGRHVEGSQVFDYWLDVDGFLIERYADGDLVNEDYPLTWVTPRPERDNNNWGPALLVKVPMVL